MEYTLTYPNIQYRRRFKVDYIKYGDILAFEYKGRTGIMFMESKSFFMFAVNLYEEEGRIWTSDEVPEGITFYETTVEERIWGMEYYLEMERLWALYNNEQELPLIGFIEKTCPTGDPCDSRPDWDFCFRLLSLAPWFQFIKSKGDTAKAIWKEASKGITNTGLLFNANKTELYCYLMGVLMIADSDFENNKFYAYPTECQNMSNHDITALLYINKLHANWDHFSWMYAMVIGRIIGTALNTFTAMVNNLQNNKRVSYLHLYLPLVERNVDKICKYSTTEKKWKLQQAIEKMKKTEQLQGQNDDLDGLFQIVFPSYFQDSMSKNRPSSTIKELREELASKDDQINRWKEMAESLSGMINEMKQCCRDNALTVEEISTLILSFDAGVDLMVYHLFDDELEDNEAWQRGRRSLLKRIKQKKEEEKKRKDEYAKQQTAAIDRQTEVLKATAKVPSMNDNNGIVTGGNLEARISLTDDQTKIIADRLAANGNTKLLE